MQKEQLTEPLNFDFPAIEYDDSKEIHMNWEYSCGAVVFTRENGHILFAVVQEQSGEFSFFPTMRPSLVLNTKEQNLF
jgi:hypothetical protein